LIISSAIFYFKTQKYTYIQLLNNLVTSAHLFVSWFYLRRWWSPRKFRLPRGTSEKTEPSVVHCSHIVWRMLSQSEFVFVIGVSWRYCRWWNVTY